MAKDDRDSPQWHGGTLGDRFADVGHAERQERQDLQGPPKGRRSGCSLLALTALVAVALLVVPFLPLSSKVRERKRS